MNTDHSCPVRDELHQAHEELRRAGDRFLDAMIGEDTRHHLRNAARHAMKAGIAALDKAEERAQQARPAAPSAT